MVIRMRIFSGAISLSFVSFLFVGCGRDDTPTANLDAVDAKPLFIVMGGNTSCQTDNEHRSNSPYATDMYKSAQSFVLGAAALRDKNWDLIASCYTDTATVYYVDSKTPNEVRSAELPEFQAYLKSAIDASSAVFVAGHSYGGWLAMKTAQYMTETTSNAEKPFGLYTVDPISRVHCSFSTPGGCTASPQDFSNAQRATLNDVTTEWVNFYQTNTFYLHASSIAESDDNLHINASHTNMDNNRRVWERIQESVTNILNGSALELVNN